MQKFLPPPSLSKPESRCGHVKLPETGELSVRKAFRCCVLTGTDPGLAHWQVVVLAGFVTSLSSLDIYPTPLRCLCCEAIHKSSTCHLCA